MRRYVSAGLLLAVVMLAGLVWAQETEEDGDTGLARLRQLGEVVKSEAVWTASYTQEYTPAGMSLGEVVGGRVWVAWPDRALFATGEPPVRWMGMAGLEIRLLDLENDTCDDHRLTLEEWERIPLVALLEPLRARERFVVDRFGSRGLKLSPLAPGGVDKVTVLIGDDGLPVQVAVHDPQGATSVFDFTAWQPADEPPQGEWLPAAPQGMDCLSGS